MGLLLAFFFFWQPCAMCTVVDVTTGNTSTNLKCKLVTTAAVTVLPHMDAVILCAGQIKCSINPPFPISTMVRHRVLQFDVNKHPFPLVLQVNWSVYDSVRGIPTFANVKVLLSTLVTSRNPLCNGYLNSRGFSVQSQPPPLLTCLWALSSIIPTSPRTRTGAATLPIL